MFYIYGFYLLYLKFKEKSVIKYILEKLLEPIIFVDFITNDLKSELFCNLIYKNISIFIKGDNKLLCEYYVENVKKIIIVDFSNDKYIIHRLNRKRIFLEYSIDSNVEEINIFVFYNEYKNKFVLDNKYPIININFINLKEIFENSKIFKKMNDFWNNIDMTDSLKLMDALISENKTIEYYYKNLNIYSKLKEVDKLNFLNEASEYNEHKTFSKIMFEKRKKNFEYKNLLSTVNLDEEKHLIFISFLFSKKKIFYLLLKNYTCNYENLNKLTYDELLMCLTLSFLNTSIDIDNIIDSIVKDKII